MRITENRLRKLIKEMLISESNRPPPPDTVVGSRPGSTPAPRVSVPRPVGAPPDTVVIRPSPYTPPTNLGPASIASRTAAAQAAARATATATGGWILPVTIAGLTGLVVGTFINDYLEKSGYADKIQDWMSKFTGKNEKELKIRASLSYVYRVFTFEDVPDDVNVNDAIITVDGTESGNRKVISFSLRGVTGVLVDSETGRIIEKRTLSCITDFVSTSDTAIGTFKVSPGRVFIPNTIVGQIKLRSNDNDITYEGIVSFPGSIAWDGTKESYVGELEYSRALEG